MTAVYGKLMSTIANPSMDRCLGRANPVLGQPTDKLQSRPGWAKAGLLRAAQFGASLLCERCWSPVVWPCIAGRVTSRGPPPTTRPLIFTGGSCTRAGASANQ